MMFFLDSAIALDLIALTLGAWLVYTAVQNKGSGAFFAKSVGTIVFILALITLLCTTFYGTKFWFKAGAEGCKHQKMMEQMAKPMEGQTAQ